MKKVKFPYYSGNIYKSEVIGHVTLEQFIFAHKHPKKETIQLIEKIEKAKKQKDEKLKRQLKQQLFSFTPSVFIKIGLPRKYDSIYNWTGLMQLDFDKIPDVETALEIKNYIFEHESIICSYISPSGTGVKALMRIKIPEDKRHYKAIHKSMVSEFESIGYLDTATNNAMLPLFLSIDKEMLVKDYNDCKTWNKEDWSEPEYVRLLDEQPEKQKNNFKSPNDNEDYEEKTIRILSNKIKNINDNGHPQVRSASLILGSRVGAGYISVSKAQSEIERLIKENSYLSKGISGYISTALWGISEGYKKPKYYD